MISEIIDTFNSFITSKFKILQNTNFLKIFTKNF